MKYLMMALLISQISPNSSWGGTSTQDPKVKEMRTMYQKAALAPNSEDLSTLLGEWVCNQRSALRDQFEYKDYAPLYNFSMWQNLVTHNAQSETEARTYIGSDWGYIGALGHHPNMTIDSLRFNPDGTLIAERIVTSVLFSKNTKLGERAVSHREYITDGFAHCRKLSSKMSSLADDEMTSFKKGFFLDFNTKLEIPTVKETAVFVVQEGVVYPGIWAWRNGVFVVLTNIADEKSDIKLDPSRPSCQVHQDGASKYLPLSLRFKPMMYSGEMSGFSLYNSLSAPDESTFLNCVPGQSRGDSQSPFTTTDLQRAWGLYLLKIKAAGAE